MEKEKEQELFASMGWSAGASQLKSPSSPAVSTLITCL